MIMNTIKTEQLSEREMLQIKGGEAEGRWVYINGVLYWVESFSIEEDPTLTPPPPPPSI